MDVTLLADPRPAWPGSQAPSLRKTGLCPFHSPHYLSLGGAQSSLSTSRFTEGKLRPRQTTLSKVTVSHPVLLLGVAGWWVQQVTHPSRRPLAAGLNSQAPSELPQGGGQDVSHGAKHRQGLGKQPPRGWARAPRKVPIGSQTVPDKALSSRGSTHLSPVHSQPLIKQLVPTHLQCPALHPTCHPTQDPVTGRHGRSPAPTGPLAPHFRQTQAGPRQGTTSKDPTTRKPFPHARP